MTLEHRLPMALRAAYLAMHRRTDACLAARGSTADQFVLLGLLAEKDGVTQQELARRAHSDPNTVRAMLVLLEGRGLVARAAHPGDGRARLVTLTADGRRLYRGLWEDTESLRKRMRALFRAEEAKALVGFLARIAEALSAQPLRAPKAMAKGAHR